MANQLSCDKCGNNYEAKNTLQISYKNKSYNFDSFECAISHIAPKCVTCNVIIIGHGLEENNQYYCCKNCMR
ncbi:MAG: hypothetical protein CME62_04225 [Halobacteriovoraceae bacterium]|nr:hypothetical protein [Halobacteriovoraceae bacterium]|tara:strand:+ start:1316 stop:1531 length:216 start_codon:yes stop_codon:yes gene_type:complete